MEKGTNAKNGRGNFLRVPKYAYVLAFLGAIVCGVWLAQIFRVYRSEVTLIVIAKSPDANLIKSDVVKNLAGIPKQLAFYEMLLAENPDVQDPYSKEDAKKRKAEWDAVIETKISKDQGDSFITISAVMPDADDAAVMAQKTVNTLITITGKYYDIKKDIDVRIVDGPVTAAHVRSWFSVVLLSFSFGLLIIVLFSFLSDYTETIREKSRPGQILKKSSLTALGSLKEMFSKKEKTVSDEDGRKEIESIYKAEEEFQAPYEIIQEGETVSEKKDSVPDNLPIMDHIPTGIYPDFPEIPVSHSRVSNAPANLPVADEDFFESKPPKFVMPDDHVTAAEIDEQPKTHEPTQEELKERLNKLLRGEV